MKAWCFCESRGLPKKEIREGCFSRWAKIILKSKWWSSEVLWAVVASVDHD